jgi:hypothetical protein
MNTLESKETLQYNAGGWPTRVIQIGGIAGGWPTRGIGGTADK